MTGLLPAIVALVAFVGCLLGLTFAWWAVTSRNQAVSEQLSARLRRPGPTFSGRAQIGLNRESSTVAASNLGNLLRQAGATESELTLMLRMGLMSVVGLLVTAWTLPGVAGVAGAALGLLPVFSLRRRARQRAEQMTEQLPDALDLLARALRAGHALTDGLRLTVEELSEPLESQFAQLAEETRLGVGLRVAMQHMLERNPQSFDLRLFASSVQLQRETGGNLAEQLLQLAETIRARVIFKHKVRALTAEVRLSAIILGALPFVLAGALMVIRPNYLLPLVTTSMGQIMVAGALCSLALALAVMNRLADVEAA